MLPVGAFRIGETDDGHVVRFRTQQIKGAHNARHERYEQQKDEQKQQPQPLGRADGGKMHVLAREDVFVVVDIAQKAPALFEEDALPLFDELAEAVARFVVPHTFFDFARVTAVLIERSAALGELSPAGDILRAGKSRGAPRVVFIRKFAVSGRGSAYVRIALFGQFVVFHKVPLSAPSRRYGQRECLQNS